MLKLSLPRRLRRSRSPTEPRRSTELPLRSELFGHEQRLQLAHELAARHTVEIRPQPTQLLARLDRNESVLRNFNRASVATGRTRQVTPAAEWLLDNFYLIEEQVRLARRHLPRNYSRELPRLVGGPSAGLPRVYDIVLELISHVDAQVEPEPLTAFVAAYQTVAPLRLGELWAIPIMLRLGLIENLQRIATRLAFGREDRDVADRWVDRLQQQAEENPSALVVVVAEMALAELPLTVSFVAEFCQRLSRRNPVLHLARDWLEQQLGEQGRSIEQCVQLESQNQAADQVSVSHSIASLRLLGSTDWRDFVEALSDVEAVLRTDPAGVYAQMDFATRDRCRHAVEALARRCPRTESAVAAAAVAAAAAHAARDGPGGRRSHVGYGLIGRGREELARAVGAKGRHRGPAAGTLRAYPLVCYLAGLTVLAALGAAGFGRWAGAADWPTPGGVLAAALAFLICTQPAAAAVNWLVTRLLPPEMLPRLDFSAGLPADCRTLVAMPVLLESVAGADRLLETIEIHHLANRDPHLHFALLTDFRDAATATTPEDAPVLERARAGIAALNRRYPGPAGEVFHLLHRPRLWNPAEDCWMGHERKRGKLADLNAYLRGGAEGCFTATEGDLPGLPPIRYVITLDADTQLPRDAARRLVGTMAHPLNRPGFAPGSDVVTEGYAIMQPRVGPTLVGAARSRLTRLFAGDAGIDPYTRAVSDVYQDLFDDGSFIGKGIYEIDAFARALAGRCPENTVLSHDLLESCHARAAFVSDIEVHEDYPAHHGVECGRRHRWIRGDWQILPWLRSRVPRADGTVRPNPISLTSQWKIFDNLRRSLVPPAQILLLVAVWGLRPESAGAAAGLVLAALAWPGLLAGLGATLGKPAELPWSLHWRGAGAVWLRQAGQFAAATAFLPAEALLNLDAILRTLWRMAVSRRRLLQWRSAATASDGARPEFAGFLRAQAAGPLAAVLAAGWFARSAPANGWPVVPLLLAWMAAPLAAWWLSRPLPTAVPDLDATQRDFLRHTARRTWHFFETFVTAEENWLPPDNFQETPEPRIAHRTSPTNIGLALLANLAAADFGWLPPGRLLRRTEETFATLQRLGRHRGHFYNWYDTRTLQPLLPLYVSTVDSGNLAGHLLTLGAGLRELAEKRCFDPAAWRGLADTAAALQALGGTAEALPRLRADLAAGAETLREAVALLERVETTAAGIETAQPAAETEIRRWAALLRTAAAEQREELRGLAPWLDQPAGPAEAPAALAALPTWRELAEGTGPAPERWREAGPWARERLTQVERLARQGEEFAAMEAAFLFDPAQELFAIGYNVTEGRRDLSYFDLLASEARLGSFVAIAQGQVPQEHWFSLGRLLVMVQGEPVLVSWSGSMFEYLMPLLVMPDYERTLLARTCEAAVRRQIAYGDACGVPWGISESGYSRTDAHQSYQYRAFGVPGLGLKRGLADDLVVAPYASALALMVAPRAACANLQRLADEGCAGAYGFYEAVDCTASRQPPDATRTLIRSFMAHHQGMTLLALLHVLGGRPMQRRFLACPTLRSAELLLQERVPRVAVELLSGPLDAEETARPATDPRAGTRILSNPSGPAPEVHLLSNGRYHVMVSGAGGGYSRWQDLAVTRWREDATCDPWGTFIYLREAAGGPAWSVAHQPMGSAPKTGEAIFASGRAEFRLRHGDIQTHTEIAVSPEDDVELRRVTLLNRGEYPRAIELTSYAEVVLATAAADAAHPAFSNLFVQTEYVPAARVLLATRRPRSADEQPPWLVHLLVAPAGAGGELSWETDRARFVGRGGNAARPAAGAAPGPLSGTTGSVLDPIVALRRTVLLPPNTEVTVDFFFGVAGSRGHALALAEKYAQPRMGDRVLALAWTHSQVTLRHLDATEAEARIFSRLAGAVLYADPARRAPANVLRSNRRGQSGLWSYGISGDAPIVLLQISEVGRIELVRQMVRAHAYWRMKGLAVDLVIVNEDVSVYRQPLQDEITRTISSGIEAQMLDKPGGIFVRRLEQIPHEDRALLQAAARIVLSDDDGSLAEQLAHPRVPEPVVPWLVPVRAPVPETPAAAPGRDLLFANGCGGFSPDGQEYVIELAPGRTTPAPWVNVIANPDFGTVVSETGAAYTWSENAHEFRLTPWHNDPVSDPCGEAIYLRDEETGEFWSPSPGPARGAGPYAIRHGFGYSVFEYTGAGIVSELWIYVAPDAPVKFAVLKVRNSSGRARRLTATGYWEWVLGDLRSRSLLHVQTEVDPKTGALLAANRYHSEFGERIAFADVTETARTLTGDRREFLGRNGRAERPAALARARLSGRVGAGLDPCAALQVPLDLAPGETRETSFRLGVGRDLAEVRDLVQRYRRPDQVRGALAEVRARWRRVLGTATVTTPDPAVNVLANGWLLYQTLGCRLWARTGFYQSGGAYGFRDQLQDVLALLPAAPELARAQILRAAARQFREGDVQHWWHPPSGRGVRTHSSDDLVWLPYVVCHYVAATGDTGVLGESAPYLAARPLKADEESCFDLPNRAEETGPLYGHCVRALRHALRLGAHGLPLIGGGDWNDGMNRIGHAGRGESVWLAFFLGDTLGRFAALARARPDPEFAAWCETARRGLEEKLSANAWDGDWYRRAYFDNGDPLGSAGNTDCQLDSLPQSWAVISGLGAPARARAGMAAVERRLVRRDGRLIQLFDPPFDRASGDPGYIKGYIPGVRENGGQYTHGAIWAVWAFALLGDHDRAWELLDLLNPVRHGATAAEIATYRAEPYVVAADVYAVAPHLGRGGWTWYTGAAGWMYRLILETLLGVRREGARLHVAPRLPGHWPGCAVDYRCGAALYRIRMRRAPTPPAGGVGVFFDGVPMPGDSVPLADDGREHTVEVLLGPA